MESTSHAGLRKAFVAVMHRRVWQAPADQRMTEEEARHLTDAVKVEGSLEVRQAIGNAGELLKWRK